MPENGNGSLHDINDTWFFPIPRNTQAKRVILHRNQDNITDVHVYIRFDLKENSSNFNNIGKFIQIPVN